MSTHIPSNMSGADVIGQALATAPSFAQLPAASQREVRDSLGKIARFLAQPVGPARQLAPDLSALRQGAPAPAYGTPVAGTAPAPNAATTPAAGAQPSGGTSTTGRVGDVARSTLNAIDFPSFVASLIQGTFQAIVDASIQQMEAYAELLKNAALTVDEFMSDNVTDGTARDYLADRFDGTFERDTSGTAPRLRVRSQAPQAEMPSFFKELGIEVPSDVTDQNVEESIVPATRRMLAERRQQTLATMVLMGINRVVVTDGEISAKLTFHVDASETASMRFDQQKTSGMNMSGTAGRNPFSANGIMVNTTSLNTQSDINVRADLVGNVVVRFRSETFPLDRFADSAAIQLINTRAKVPTA
ncbi:MAG: hypothetical protein HOW73_07695, partial [Polyangiaceae bacterium]|nr:hypothetical protein [Polyangiaceae bacterium]